MGNFLHQMIMNSLVLLLNNNFNNFHYVLVDTSSSDGDLGSDNEGTGEQIIFINKNVEKILCFWRLYCFRIYR